VVPLKGCLVYVSYLMPQNCHHSCSSTSFTQCTISQLLQCQIVQWTHCQCLYLLTFSLLLLYTRKLDGELLLHLVDGELLQTVWISLDLGSDMVESGSELASAMVSFSVKPSLLEYVVAANLELWNRILTYLIHEHDGCLDYEWYILWITGVEAIWNILFSQE